MSNKRDININGRSVIKVEIKKKRPLHMMNKPKAEAILSANDIARRQNALKNFKNTSTTGSVEETKTTDDIRKRAAFFGNRDLLKSLQPPKPRAPRAPFNKNNTTFRSRAEGGTYDSQRPHSFHNKSNPSGAYQAKTDYDKNKITHLKSLILKTPYKTSTSLTSSFADKTSTQVKKTPVTDKKIKKVYASKNVRSKLKPVASTNRIGKQILGKLESDDDIASLDSHLTRHDKYKKLNKRKSKETTVKQKIIPIFNGMFAQGLSDAMSISIDALLNSAQDLGYSLDKASALDVDTASLLVESFGYEYVKKSHAFDKMVIDKGEGVDYTSKPPVVSVVGHVDHGKTSLLDRIRSTNVVNQESGGITQGIGASEIPIGKSFITFIDTPGHEIFTQMRLKGVQVTDIVLLIVAADSGIQEQTIESINHIKASKAFCIVVITKSDAKGADPDKVRQMLMHHDIFVETLGGDIPDIEVSAKTGYNIDELLQLIIAHSELLELKTNPVVTASGVVLESKVDKFKGNLITVIIKNGTLKKNDYFVAGNHYGKTKSIINSHGKIMDRALPGQAVQIMGANDLPEMGSEFIVMSEQNAKLVIERKHEISSLASLVHSVDRKKYTHVDILNSLLKHINNTKEFHFIIKADSIGSVEALFAGIFNVDFKGIPYTVVAKSVGAVNESDVALAKATDARIIAFRVSATPASTKLATMESIDIYKYDVIYKFFEDLKDEIDNILKPKEQEVSIGKAEVVALFTKPKIGTIAGCFVRDGVIKVGAKATVIRDGKHVYTSSIVSLKRTRDDKREVFVNQDCGIVMENYNDFKMGDMIECFEIEKLE